MGKSKLTDKIATLIIDLASLGYKKKDIAEIVGVDPTTMNKWKNIGKRSLEKDPKTHTEHERRCVIVNQGIQQGEVPVLIEAHRKIVDSDSWSAAAWLLERRLPKLYAKRIQFDPDELDKYLRLNFSENTVDQIYAAMEEDAILESKRNSDQENGEEPKNANGSKMETDSAKSQSEKSSVSDSVGGTEMEAGYSTLPGSLFQSPQQRAAKLEGTNS